MDLKIPPMKSSYELIIDDGGKGPSIKCLQCGMKSYSQNDIKYKWCECCLKFHDIGYIKRILGLRPDVYSSVDFNTGIDLAAKVLIDHKVDDDVIEKVIQLKHLF
jgi:hypothetical protein